MKKLDFKQFNDVDLEIIWAALTTMVKDIHAPQDNLNEEQMQHAEDLWKVADAEMNQRHPS